MIVAIGDSITAGQHLPDGEQPWPALITGHSIVAAGIPADTTRLGLERFPSDVQAVNPEAVIIQFGHNDCNRWQTDRGLPRVSEAAYAANLIEMIDRCRAFEATPFVCSLTPSLRSERHAKDAERYDLILREVAVAKEVRLIDVRTFFQGWEDISELLIADGLHLNARGHRIYAAAVQSALDSQR